MGVDVLIIKPGFGSTPTFGQKVSVHYTGKLIDGTRFDSSRDRGRPYRFHIGKGDVIRGWDVGIEKMRKGDRAILTCSSDFAYGARGVPGVVLPHSVLIFDVELIDIE